MWHLDYRGQGDPDQPRIARLFGFVNDVSPRGGGTLVVEGSHELIRRMVAAVPDHNAGSSAELKKILAKRHEWFGALQRRSDDNDKRIARFMGDYEDVDGVAVRVAELTGQVGDVAVMMPWTMHNIAMNCADHPRFMVTHTIVCT